MDEWMWWIVDGAARPENSAGRPRAPTLFSVDLADAEARAWEWDAPSPFAGHYLTRQPGWIEHRCLLSSFPITDEKKNLRGGKTMLVCPSLTRANTDRYV